MLTNRTTKEAPTSKRSRRVLSGLAIVLGALAVTGVLASGANADMIANGRSRIHTVTLCGTAPGNMGIPHTVSADTSQSGNENVYVMYYFSTDGKNYTHYNQWFKVASDGDTIHPKNYQSGSLPTGWIRVAAYIAVATPNGWAYAMDYNVEAKSFDGGYSGSMTRNDGWCYNY